MAPNTGASAPFLEQVVAGVGTDTKYTKKMVPNTSRCTTWRRHVGSIPRHAKREVANRTCAGGVSWERWPSGKDPGRKWNINETSAYAMSTGI